jgi:hypothetical protein
VTSLTKDFEWHEHDIPSLTMLLLETVGIQLSDDLLIRTSNEAIPLIEKE